MTDKYEYLMRTGIAIMLDTKRLRWPLYDIASTMAELLCLELKCD